MRYAKGSIALSRTHDYPMLRQVLRSQFVTRSQLLELMQLGGHQCKPKVFDWRLDRLVTHGFVVKHRVPAVGVEPVYSISAIGAAVLQGVGECFVPLPAPRNQQDRQINPLHAVELNDIRLALLRAGLEILWVPESEIRSQNEYTSFKLAKDYDALVTVSVDGRSARFALEYERTAKNNKDYRDIAEAVGGERTVENILYLFPNHDLLNFVARFFDRVRVPTFFGLATDWRERLLDMPIFTARGERYQALRKVLR